jgi:hypothetical protein
VIKDKSRETCVCDACEVMNLEHAQARYRKYVAIQSDGTELFGQAFRAAVARDGWRQLVNHAGIVRRCPPCEAAFVSAVASAGSDPKLIEMKEELDALRANRRRLDS